ncbi:hypothetical protein V8C34DRAFT_228542 [Trichoderma compactum]
MKQTMAALLPDGCNCRSMDGARITASMLLLAPASFFPGQGSASCRRHSVAEARRSRCLSGAACSYFLQPAAASPELDTITSHHTPKSSRYSLASLAAVQGHRFSFDLSLYQTPMS